MLLHLPQGNTQTVELLIASKIRELKIPWE